VFPAGGPTGGLVVSLLNDARVPCRQIAIAASTRESFTVNEESTGQQYRFVLPGPRLTFTEQARCLDELRMAAESAEFVVASGSLPSGVPPDYYQRVADICRDVGARFILDTSGGGLQHVSSGVYLLKVSVRELRERVGRPLATESEQFAAAQELVESGCAQVALVSLGSHGALLATPRGGHRFSAIPMRGGSGVGAGDAMVAATTIGLSRGWPLVKSVRLGIAAGAAMLTTPGTAACDRAHVERFFELVAEPSDVDPAPRV
jgi:6-phosphofructokinase 2